jgi:pimeloyl-ACP methyl ester carboxylesterase
MELGRFVHCDALCLALDFWVEIARTSVAEIAYFECGQSDGFPVLFLHGFPDDALTWDGVVAKLQGLPLRLVRPFLRGFGPSRVTVSEAQSGQVAALAQDVIDLADALGIYRFAVVGQDWGSRAGHAAAVLAPKRVTWLVALATGYGPEPDDPGSRLRQTHAFWYQWWFHTAAGRVALKRDRVRVCEYLWRVWSPQWRFQPDQFNAVTPSFQNEQFVDTVIHYYQHRWLAAPGRPRYESQETQLRGTPAIPVPTTFICGTADACNLPESSCGNEKFFPAGLDRSELPGVGHFVQRERPDVVAEAVRRKMGVSPA